MEPCQSRNQYQQKFPPKKHNYEKISISDVMYHREEQDLQMIDYEIHTLQKIQQNLRIGSLQHTPKQNCVASVMHAW